MSVPITKINYQAAEDRDVNLRVLGLTTVGDIECLGSVRQQVGNFATISTGSNISAAMIYGKLIYFASTANGAGLTTDSAAQILALYPTAQVFDSVPLYFVNMSSYSAILSPGLGIDLMGGASLPAQSSALGGGSSFIMVFTNVTPNHEAVTLSRVG